MLPGSFVAMLVGGKVFRGRIRLLSLVWVGSLAGILVGEIAKSPILMMASGGLFVVTTAFMATLVTVRGVTKLYLLVRAQVRG